MISRYADEVFMAHRGQIPFVFRIHFKVAIRWTGKYEVMPSTTVLLDVQSISNTPVWHREVSVAQNLKPLDSVCLHLLASQFHACVLMTQHTRNNTTHTSPTEGVRIFALSWDKPSVHQFTNHWSKCSSCGSQCSASFGCPFGFQTLAIQVGCQVLLTAWFAFMPSPVEYNQTLFLPVPPPGIARKSFSFFSAFHVALSPIAKVFALPLESPPVETSSSDRRMPFSATAQHRTASCRTCRLHWIWTWG